MLECPFRRAEGAVSKIITSAAAGVRAASSNDADYIFGSMA
jgi:hypothetical protein